MVGLPGGVEKRRFDVRGLEKGVVAQDFLVRRAGGEQFEQIGDAKSLPADAGTAPALARFDGDAFEKFHRASLTGPVARGKRTQA